MKTITHLHKLKRKTYKTGTLTYFCVNDCSFRISPELTLGRIVECWRCSKPFSMNTYSMALAKPHCEECHKFKNDNLARKKGSNQALPIQPLTVVADSIGSDLVNDLRQRLEEILVVNDGNVLIVDKSAEEALDKVEYKEFKLDEEEFL